MNRFQVAAVALLVAGVPALAADPAPAKGEVVHQLAGCPIKIQPGKSLGPVQLGDTLEALKKKKVDLKRLGETTSGEVTFYESFPYHVELLGAKVADIWIDDIRQVANCITYKGKPVDRNLDAKKLIALFKDCGNGDYAEGGTFYYCKEGVTVGLGMHDVVQLRVNTNGHGVNSEFGKILAPAKK